MSEKIKTSTQNLREFITSQIKSDMEKSEIDKYQEILKELDTINSEDDARDKELVECKEVIIKQVKTSGSKDEPKEQESEKEPRSLEEIAQSIENGGK